MRANSEKASMDEPKDSGFHTNLDRFRDNDLAMLAQRKQKFSIL
jgi:hypothetical protein